MNNWHRFLWMLGFAVFTAGIDLAMSYFNGKSIGDLSSKAIASIILMAAVTGPVIELFREGYTIITKQAEQLDSFNKVIDVHTWSIPNIKKMRKAFDALQERKHKEFIRDLIHTSAVERIWLVPKYQNHEFYTVLVKGFKICDNWSGIHQGEIGLLLEDDNADLRNDYLEALRIFAETENKIARRIVIVKERSEFDELKDPKSLLLKDFKTTAGNVHSYMILEKSIEDILDGKDLKDAALLDNSIFLQHDRDKLVLDFECGKGAKKAKIVRALFKKLDAYIANPRQSALKFYRIS